VQAKEFVRRYHGKVSLKEEWIAMLVFVVHTVVEEVGDRPVCEAAWTGLGFRGEIWLMASSVFGSEGMLDHELHGCAGGASGDGDVLLSWFFGGDGSCEEGVITAIGWLGDCVVVSRAVVEE